MIRKRIALFLAVLMVLCSILSEPQQIMALDNIDETNSVSTFQETKAVLETEVVLNDKETEAVIESEETEGSQEVQSSEIEEIILPEVILEQPAVLSDAPGAETIYCWVSVNGSWQKVGTLSSDGWRDSRFYVKASKLEEIYGNYGFDLDEYSEAKRSGQNLASTYVFGHENANKSSTTIWYDSLDDYYTVSDTDETIVVPIGNVNGGTFNLYYTPGHASLSSGNLIMYEESQTFYTVDIKDSENLVSSDLKYQLGTRYIFGGETKAIVLKYDDFNWECTDSSGMIIEGVIDHTDKTVTFFLEGDDNYTISSKMLILKLNIDGEIVGEFYVPSRTNLWNWLQKNKEIEISSSEKHPNIGAYTWKVENSDKDITESTAPITSNTIIVGTPKDMVTIRFAESKPDTTEDIECGGTFKDKSEAYTTITIHQGENIPEEFLNKMYENIEVKDTHTFIGWYYSGDTVIGELEVTKDTPMAESTTVYAKYKTKAVYTFYTDRTKATIYQQYTDLPIGFEFDRILADPVSNDGKLFRYWINITENKVFSNNDIVTGDAEFYPVFERLIFEFKNGDKFLYSLYDGDIMKYSGEPKDGEYFAGFEIDTADGEKVIIRNGMTITASNLVNSGIAIPDVNEGKYTIQAKPIYKTQHKIIYHNGSDGQLVVTDSGDDTRHTVTVEDQVTLLGPLDIMNVTSAIGLALEGWANSETDAEQGVITYSSYEVLDEEMLDTSAGEDDVLELWPVWGQTDSSVKVTFVSNYSTDAVDSQGNGLSEVTYILYIPKNTKPTLPLFEAIGIEEPSNTFEKEEGTQNRFIGVGWSINPDGSGKDFNGNVSGDVSKQYGVYSQGSQYDLTLSEDTVFYAIWVDKRSASENFDASFFIRMDGTMPKEPNQYQDTSAYSPSSKGHTYLKITNALYETKNVVNDSEKVAANIKNEPGAERILEALDADGYDSSEHWQDMIQGYIANSDGTYTYSGEGSTYGTLWWVEWYACKAVSCPYCTYHVDGRIRFSDEVELNYHGNGGSNVPAGTVHEINSVVEPKYVNGFVKPERDNHIFMGWSEDADALYPTYYDPDYLKEHETQGNPMVSIQMNEDKDLYAIWEPASTMVPLDGAFSGKKTLISTDEDITLNAGDFSFQMTLIQKPEKSQDWSKSTVNAENGDFDFGQFEVKYPGTYVFEIKEVIGNDTNIQYDTRIYRLTIRMAVTEAGLGIGGYSFTENGKPVIVNSSNVADAVFQFTNQYGKRDITVKKTWNDDDDADGIRADEITVSLLQNGRMLTGEEGSQTLDASNEWSYTWKNLPTEDAYGVAYEYTVKENTIVSGYASEVKGDMYTGFEIVNTHEVMDREVAIEKMVTGNMGDDSKQFDFCVIVKDKDGNRVTDLETPKDGTYMVNSNGEIEFNLRHGESITIKDVPYKSTLIVNEMDYSEEKYETSYSESGKIDGTQNCYFITDNLKISVTNHKEGLIDTGIVLDGTGYLIMLSAAAAGAMLLLWRRRLRDD